jgi:protein-tyrosine phosphatase
LPPVPRFKSILVICDGNYCRSPIAEALLKAGVGTGGPRVESAGLTALEGLPPHPVAQQVMAEQGLDISGHRGRQLTLPIALAADLILVMDERQKRDCGHLAPSARGRLFLLGHWQPEGRKEIPDPSRGGAKAIYGSYEQISRAVADWVPRLVSNQRSA